MNDEQSAVKKANLILKYQKGTLTPEEQEELQVWLEEDLANKRLLAELNDEQKLTEGIQFLASINKQTAWERINEKINEPDTSRPVRSLWTTYWKYGVAAILSLCLGYVLYLRTYIGKRSMDKVVVTASVKNDVLPGGNKATLTLADGSVMDLEALKNGMFREENGIRVQKKNGQLVYEVITPLPNQAVSYNTINTPIGGQYKVILPDGSQVWLNAASSLRFPTTFLGKFRQVELTGEGYFEIAKNKGMPFVVQTGKTSVEVLGTHFNIMSYAHEGPVKTTLLEGSVNVSNGLDRKRLLPGQQALMSESIKVYTVETNEVIAWKNGYFQFENEDLKTILRQLRRWYAFELDDELQIPNKHFTAVISRNTTLAQVLTMLEMSGELTFTITNNRVKIKEHH